MLFLGFLPEKCIPGTDLVMLASRLVIVEIEVMLNLLNGLVVLRGNLHCCVVELQPRSLKITGKLVLFLLSVT